MREICPCCKRAIPKPRTTQPKTYIDDLAKASAAVAAIEGTIKRNWNPLVPDRWSQKITGAAERPEFIAACKLELARMKRALGDPELLWSIYRRRFPKNGAAYGLGVELKKAA